MINITVRYTSTRYLKKIFDWVRGASSHVPRVEIEGDVNVEDVTIDNWPESQTIDGNVGLESKFENLHTNTSVDSDGEEIDVRGYSTAAFQLIASEDFDGSVRFEGCVKEGEWEDLTVFFDESFDPYAWYYNPAGWTTETNISGIYTADIRGLNKIRARVIYGAAGNVDVDVGITTSGSANKVLVAGGEMDAYVMNDALSVTEVSDPMHLVEHTESWDGGKDTVIIEIPEDFKGKNLYVAVDNTGVDVSFSVRFSYEVLDGDWWPEDYARVENGISNGKEVYNFGYDKIFYGARMEFEFDYTPDEYTETKFYVWGG